MNKIGFMQGRLSAPVNGKIQAFPWGSWEKEFILARECGLDCVDWIIETHRLDENPLLTDQGFERIKNLENDTGTSVISVCADYFMENPLIRCSDQQLRQRLETFEHIIERVAKAGISFLELPFVDNARINDQKEMDDVVAILKPFLDRLKQNGITLAFETSLNASTFKDFLSKFNHSSVQANYDTGNSASLGFDVKEEWAAYGSRVVTVHIKDRVLNGTTVPLGEGNANFKDCFAAFRNANYQGPLILQVARGRDDVEVIKQSLEFVKDQLHQSV